MLDSLRFVQGAVAKKDYVATLMHFRIKNKTVCGYNGSIALNSPIELDLDTCPLATQFVKAIQTCQDTIQLHMTPAGRLAVKSGKFKAFVDCIQEEFPKIAPEGKEVQLSGNLLGTLKQLSPFIAEDASRPWARGILLRGQSAFATNNVILVEKWLGAPFPVEVNIPRMAVAELLRIGTEPTHLQICENSVTFHFQGNRWLRTQLSTLAWPDLSPILDKKSNQAIPPKDLWQAIEEIKPFVDEVGRVHLSPGKIATHIAEGVGAVVELPEVTTNGCFHFEQLLLLQDVVKTIDLSSYPSPCLFYGEVIRGAIIGMRL